MGVDGGGMILGTDDAAIATHYGPEQLPQVAALCVIDDAVREDPVEPSLQDVHRPLFSRVPVCRDPRFEKARFGVGDDTVRKDTLRKSQHLGQVTLSPTRPVEPDIDRLAVLVDRRARRLFSNRRPVQHDTECRLVLDATSEPSRTFYATVSG